MVKVRTQTRGTKPALTGQWESLTEQEAQGALKESADKHKRRTALYNRAWDIANEHGFSMVGKAYEYIKNAPADDQTFTRKERGTIIYVINQIYGDAYQPDTTPQFTGAATTATIPVTTVNGQVYNVPQLKAGTGSGVVIHQYRKSAFEKSKEQIAAQIRDYLIDRYAGITTGVACVTERTVFINRASNAANRLYGSATDLDSDLSALADAYAITKAGVITTAINTEAQEAIAMRVTLIRQCAATVRKAVLEIDAINQRMEKAQTLPKVAKKQEVVDGDAVAAG